MSKVGVNVGKNTAPEINEGFTMLRSAPSVVEPEFVVSWMNQPSMAGIPAAALPWIAVTRFANVVILPTPWTWLPEAQDTQICAFDTFKRFSSGQFVTEDWVHPPF